MTLTDAFSTMIEQLKETVLTLCAQLMEAVRGICMMKFTSYIMISSATTF